MAHAAIYFKLLKNVNPIIHHTKYNAYQVRDRNIHPLLKIDPISIKVLEEAVKSE